MASNIGELGKMKRGKSGSFTVHYWGFSNIPEGMAVLAGLILDGVSTYDVRSDQDCGSLLNRRFAPAGFHHQLAVVSMAQLADGGPLGIKMVDTGFQPGEVTTDQIEIDVIEGTGARRRAERQGDTGRLCNGAAL
jgi:hypothetical protein